MKKDKILLLTTDLNNIEAYKKEGLNNFLFALKGYSIGYNSFLFDEIKDIDANVYILMNRLLTDTDIDEFLKLDIPKNVKGFIIEDIGLLEVIDKKYKVIIFENHLNNNYETINIMLEDADSLVISNDITLDEIETILSKTNKNLVLFAFGKQMVMYSRRYLVTNYLKEYDYDIKHELLVTEKVSGKEFYLKENEYGTAIFNNKYLDYRNNLQKIDDNKIMHYIIDTSNLSSKDVIDIINMKPFENVTDGFMHKNTVYKVGDLDD